MKYLRELLKQLLDKDFLVLEFGIIWIAFCLTFLVIATILYYIQ